MAHVKLYEFNLNADSYDWFKTVQSFPDWLLHIQTMLKLV